MYTLGLQYREEIQSNILKGSAVDMVLPLFFVSDDFDDQSVLRVIPAEIQGEKIKEKEEAVVIDSPVTDTCCVLRTL